jgi:hypothetical protein
MLRLRFSPMVRLLPPPGLLIPRAQCRVPTWVLPFVLCSSGIPLRPPDTTANGASEYNFGIRTYYRTLFRLFSPWVGFFVWKSLLLYFGHSARPPPSSLSRRAFVCVRWLYRESFSSFLFFFLAVASVGLVSRRSVGCYLLVLAWPCHGVLPWPWPSA